MTITTEKIQELIKNIMAGYEQYITEKGYTDPDQFDEYLMEYLQTDEAKKIISDWMSEVMPEDHSLKHMPNNLSQDHLIVSQAVPVLSQSSDLPA